MKEDAMRGSRICGAALVAVLLVGMGCDGDDDTTESDASGGMAGGGPPGTSGQSPGEAGANGDAGGAGVQLGGAGGFDNSPCARREVRTCNGDWFVSTTGSCRSTPEPRDPECRGDGFETYQACLEACDPESPCLIPPLPQSAPSMAVDPCDPEVHTVVCEFDAYCRCSCEEGSGEATWWCVC
jgi:hypothetical protein